MTLRRQRNTAIFCGLTLMAAAAFGLRGWAAFGPYAVKYWIAKLAHYSVSYATLAALALLMALTAAPARWLERVLAPLGRTPALLPGAVLTLCGAGLVYRLWPLWTFFLGGAIAVGALFWLLRREASLLADRTLTSCTQTRAFPVLVAVFASVATFVLNRVLYEGQPHVIDSWARYAHILMMSQGHWCFPAPLDWQWTVHYGMVNDGVHYASQYQPGILLIGLLGHFLGSLAVLPALLAGGVALLTYLVGRRIYDAPTAALGSLLLALSGNFLYLSASFMEHTPATFFLMMALWLGLRDLERRRWPNALALGFCVGYACITRSLSSLGWAVPLLAVWAVLRWRQWRWQGLPSWTAALAGWAVPVAFFLYFNHQTTGSAFVPGYKAADPVTHSLGFTSANHHTPLLGLTYQWNNLWALSEWLFFWPVTSYLFVVALFLTARWERRDTLLALPFAGLAACYFFYPYQDFGFSPRFLSEAIPLLALLTARGILAAADHLRQHAPGSAPRVWSRAMLTLLIGLFALAIPAARPKFAKEYYDQHLGVLALGRVLAPFHDIPNATVFLVQQPYAHRAIVDEVQCWGGARFLEESSVELRDEYVRAHPERRCFLLGGGAQAVELKPQ